MAPDQRIVDRGPVDDGIEGEAEGPELLFLALLTRAADLLTFAIVECAGQGDDVVPCG